MKYLLIGFTLSIGWHLAKVLLEEIHIYIYKKKNCKHKILPDTVNYKVYK